MRAAFPVTKAVVPGMTARGYGRIVYLGTVLSRPPREGMIALGTSKALGSFARYLIHQLLSHGQAASPCGGAVPVLRIG